MGDEGGGGVLGGGVGSSGGPVGGEDGGSIGGEDGGSEGGVGGEGQNCDCHQTSPPHMLPEKYASPQVSWKSLATSPAPSAEAKRS